MVLPAETSLSSFQRMLTSAKAFTFTMLALITSFSIIRVFDFPETDIFWGARNGQETLTQGLRIFQPDEWNAMTLGETWSPNSWLWNVFLAVAHNLFGVWGFILLTFLTMFVTLFLVWRITARLSFQPIYQFTVVLWSWMTLFLWMNGRANTITAFITVLFVYLTLVVFQRYLAKPEVKQVFVYSAVFVTALLVTAVWVNFHLTAVIAIALFPVVTYIIASGKVNFLRRVLLAFCSGVGVLAGLGLSPFGWQSLVKVSLVENESKGFFYEWSPLYAGGEINWLIVSTILFAVAVVGVLVFDAVKRWKQTGKFTCPVVAILSLLAFSYATFDTIRLSTFLLGLTLAALTLVPVNKIAPVKVKYQAPMFGVAVLSVGVAVFLSVLIVMNPYRTQPLDPEGFQSVPAGSVVLSTAKVSGGFILYRPDTLVLIDGRNDLIGKERYLEANNILYTDDKAELEAFLKEWDVDAVYLPAHVVNESVTPVTVLLDELSWKLVAQNKDGSTTWLAPSFE